MAEKRLLRSFIADLERVKDLLEAYNLGEARLADAWDFISLRLDQYRLLLNPPKKHTAYRRKICGGTFTTADGREGCTWPRTATP
ncbi:hypothetical protein [Candidatus Hecatella orcuttiae]|jgi:hypothetical protein|uniref:hypothetical protein n=1 Tax=Candidatus Hecatella orcuttiae TaxID=1935119 RepID=UPI002867D341|nr:hypothetical protein [Candidatus Hecatella orcuttiae]